jgi:glycosyltransferase involved in cell wall biosynthesis
MNRELLCVGDATDIATWSGTPFHFLCAGQAAGFLSGGWPLRPERLRAQRLLWNAAELLRTGRRGGFQYTEAFLRALVKGEAAASGADELVSHFPLLPSPGPLSSRTSYYIDATLKQLFEDYGFARIVSPRVIADALAREGENYRAAPRIVCMCRWAAQSVVEDYGIDPRKVHVIAGGSNLDEAKLDGLADVGATASLRPLRLAFVGKDTGRKNLAFLLSVAEILDRKGYPVEVAAAGFDPARVENHRLLRAVGFIDKRGRLDAFVSFVRSAHFGCLFSHAEASPRSNREFIRLGVPVLTWHVGGMADTVPAGLGHVFRRGADAEEVADTIGGYCREPERYHGLRQRVAARAHEAGWTYAVEQFRQVWSGSEQFSYAAATGGRSLASLQGETA